MDEVESKGYSLSTRVYLEDTDAGGIVYYVNYLKYMERARTEWLRQQGGNFGTLREQGYLFVVHSLQIDYHRPAQVDDVLKVSAEIEQRARCYIVFRQRIDCGEQLVCSARVKVACVKADSKRPCAIPGNIF